MKYTLLLTLILLSACQEKSTNINSEPNNITKIAESQTCEADVKTCPNGRSVKRNPQKNCKFDPCNRKPKTIEPRMCTTDVKQCPDGSFVGRDSYNNCEFKPCTTINNGRNTP